MRTWVLASLLSVPLCEVRASLRWLELRQKLSRVMLPSCSALQRRRTN